MLSGSAGGLGTSFNNGGSTTNVGASLVQPIYNGGALRAEKRKALAEYEEADGAYRQTVLQAFKQAADTLRAIEHDAQTLQARSEAATQAEAAYQIASRRYNAGGISQVALLDAQRQHLQTAPDRYCDSATLLQALGGGWWNQTQTGASGSIPPNKSP